MREMAVFPEQHELLVVEVPAPTVRGDPGNDRTRPACGAGRQDC